MADTTTSDRRLISGVIVLAIALWLLRLLPLLTPGARLWGINHLQFLSSGYTLAYVALGLLALLGLIRPVRQGMEKGLGLVAEALFRDDRYFRPFVVALVLGAMFWFFRMPINFLGDGYNVADHLAGIAPTIFKWTEAGAVGTVYAVSRLLPLEGLAGAQYAYALVSVIAGIATIILFWLLAWEAGRDAMERLFAFCLMLFSGWTLLFFGYVENYPIIWPFVLAYLYTALRYLTNRGGLFWPTLFLSLAMIMHLQVLFFGLSYAVLIISRGTGQRFYQKHRKAVIAAAIVAAATAIAFVVVAYARSITFRVVLLPPFIGRPVAPGYTILSLKHLLDIVNEFSLLIPLWPVLLMAGWAGVRSAVHDAPGRFLLACTVGGCGFLLIVNPRLGMGRDWDLFALTAVGPMLLLVRAVAAQGIRIIRVRSSLLILSLVLVAPFFFINLSYGSSIEYFKWLLRLDAGRSRPGLVALRNYYRTTGDAAQADSLDRIMVEKFPAVYLVPRAKALAVSGKYQEALALADSVFRIDPYASEPYNLRGVIYLEMKAFDRAVADLRQAVAFAPYDHRMLVNLAIAYQGLDKYEQMLPVLRRAQEISPKYPLLLECLAMMFTGMNRYDSVQIYAQALMQVDSLNDRAYLIAGGAAYALGDHALAKKYLTHYLTLNPSGREASDADAILKLLQ